MDADACIEVGPGSDGKPRARRLRTAAPLGARMAGGELHLVGTAAGPMGGDHVRLELHVAPGVQLVVRSVAATVALRGDGTASSTQVVATVGPGAFLAWLVEPLVATVGCDHRAAASVTLAEGASLLWRDELVLGRSGERPGRCASSLRVCRDDLPLVHHEVSTARPGWDAPSVTAGARALGHLAAVGVAVEDPGACAPGAQATRFDLGDQVQVVVAMAQNHARLRAALGPPGTMVDRP